MSGDTRGYSLDVSDYLFRLTTESLRLLSNETKRYHSLTSMVNQLAGAGAADAIAQHDVETLRQHLSKIPTKGPIRIHLHITKTSADNLIEAKKRLAKELGSSLTVGDAISMLLFDFVVDQSASRLLSKLGVDEAGQSRDEPSPDRDTSDNVVRLK
jgi:hypothetical protein